MNTKNYIYMALGTLFMLTSCAKDEPANREMSRDSNRIYFRSYLPIVTLARAGDVTSANFKECQVTCFNPDDNKSINPTTGEMTPYFTDICFENDGSGRFFSKGDDECIWPNANCKLHFFAYYPSVDSMKKISGDSYFNLVNSSKLTDEAPVFDYRLERFRVAADIADQVDFLTAYSTGSLSTDGETGIQLEFKHQLARVELTAWGANDKYDFEIAGVRIGNPIVEGDFNLSAFPSVSGEGMLWHNTLGHQAPVEHIFNAGESIVLLSKSAGSHASEETASSIMGKAGAAMMIPITSRIDPWEGKGDPATAAPDYSTDKMYFSVLLRVKNGDGKVAYPYPNSNDEMTIIYFAVDKENRMINKRLYKIDGAYYTSAVEGDESRYTSTDSEDICGFSWAALPVPAKWDAGKKYTYKLNYSDGIGWHDPADPEPGEPIIERGNVPFNISIDEWLPAEDYTPDINVPKR